jgi:hypothetical protein
MSFFKSLFAKVKPKEDPSIPAPTQNVPGLDPMIVLAIENLFPNEEVQKEFFDGIQRYIQNANTLIVLALLSMTKADDVYASKEYVLGTLSKPVIGTNTHYFIMRDCDFRDMTGATKWVKSIIRPQV